MTIVSKPCILCLYIYIYACKVIILETYTYMEHTVLIDCLKTNQLLQYSHADKRYYNSVRSMFKTLQENKVTESCLI